MRYYDLMKKTPRNRGVFSIPHRSCAILATNAYFDTSFIGLHKGFISVAKVAFLSLGLQISSITPHVCRHTYCSNMAKSGMNLKTLQYLMGHSDIGVTVNLSKGHTPKAAINDKERYR